jgi:hypothetical protein
VGYDAVASQEDAATVKVELKYSSEILELASYHSTQKTAADTYQRPTVR